MLRSDVGYDHIEVLSSGSQANQSAETFLSIMIWWQNVFDWLSSIAANLQWDWGLNIHKAGLLVLSDFFSASNQPSITQQFMSPQ